MKSLVSLGLYTLVLLSFSSHVSVLARDNGLPKLSAVNNPARGAGCAFYLSKQSKKAIFVDVGEGPTMNFNGRDTILQKVSTQSSKKSSTTIYSTENMRIQIDTKSIANYTESPNTKAKITITRNDKSKVVKAIGYCGC
jgi:hypothetical protein